MLDDIEHIHDSVPFERLKGARILITGATGFIGRWMRLVPNYMDIVVGDHQSHQRRLQGKYDHIVHLAPAPIEPVIECAARTGAKILFASSGAVEHDPHCNYARGKLAAEDALFASDQKYVIGRLYAFSGYGLSDHYAITRFINNAYDGEPLVVQGNGQNKRSYLYASDMAVWLWRLLIDGKDGETYNVGSDDGYTILEIAHQIAREFRNTHVVISGDNSDVKVNYVPDITKAEEELGLRVWVKHMEGIKRMIRGMQYA